MKLRIDGRIHEVDTQVEADRVRLVVGEGGHQFYPKEAWPVIGEMAQAL